MSTFARAIGIALLILSGPPAARADFRWLDDWQATPSGDATFGGTDTSGSASASAFLPTGDYFHTVGDGGGVDFVRHFRIVDEPTGLPLELTASVTGTTTVVGIHSIASAYGGISITPGTGPSFSFGHQDGPGVFGGDFDPVLFDETVTLTDGLYTVTGSLGAGVLVPADYFPFIYGGGSATATLNFTLRAVPAPSSLGLLGVGLVGVLVGRSRRRPAH